MPPVKFSRARILVEWSIGSKPAAEKAIYFQHLQQATKPLVARVPKSNLGFGALPYRLEQTHAGSDRYI